jgi:hypothetical protein
MESLKLTEGTNIIGIDRMDQYTIKTPMAGLHAWLGWFAFLKMPMLKASQSKVQKPKKVLHSRHMQDPNPNERNIVHHLLVEAAERCFWGPQLPAGFTQKSTR